MDAVPLTAEDAPELAAEFCAPPSDAEMDAMYADLHADLHPSPNGPEPTQARPDDACDIEYPVRRGTRNG